ncbi:hypothetical protein H0H93_008536 [Arthromyces matolae]|nr:hypothetical protein H0H93_008536 [Arthromyces matolae]
MLSLSAAQIANAAFKPSYSPLAIFVGGTSGIGQGLAEAFAHHTNGNAHIIIVGRNRAAADSIISHFPKPSDPAKYPHEFNVDSLTKELLARFAKINFLFMSPGIITMKGRDETEEGIDTKLALHYYARWKLVNDLAPALAKAKEAGEDSKVISILGAGRGGEIDLNDLGLKKTFSLNNAALSAPTYNDLMFQEFAERYPALTFVHSCPGYVRTPAMKSSDSFLLNLASPLYLSLSRPFSKSIRDAGEFQLYGLLSKQEGFFRVGDRGEDLGMKKYFGSAEARKTLWEHTVLWRHQRHKTTVPSPHRPRVFEDDQEVLQLARNAVENLGVRQPVLEQLPYSSGYWTTGAQGQAQAGTSAAGAASTTNGSAAATASTANASYTPGSHYPNVTPSSGYTPGTTTGSAAATTSTTSGYTLPTGSGPSSLDAAGLLRFATSGSLATVPGATLPIHRPHGAGGDDDGDGDDDMLPAMADDDYSAQLSFQSQSKDNLKVLMDNFSPEQYERFEAYRRHALPKAAVRKVIQQALGQQVSQPVAQIVAGFGKVFVGEIVERVFGTRKYDHEGLEASVKETNGMELTFLDPLLDKTTSLLAEGHQAVSIFVNDVCDAAVLEELHKHGVKYVALRCAGYNNVDLAAAEKLGIKVVRVPSYAPEAIAEFAVGMLLTVVRKYHKSFLRVREGNFLLDGLMGFNLSGKTVGLIGTGKIGLITGRILSKGFCCNVIAYDPYPVPKEAEEHGIKYVDKLEDLLRQSDIISLHCPLTPQTRYMINDNTLAMTKQGVVLINTSRGGLIDSYSLIRFLKSGHLGAVGLDVYEKESAYFFADSSAKIIHDDVFARLLSFYNVFMTQVMLFPSVVS